MRKDYRILERPLETKWDEFCVPTYTYNFVFIKYSTGKVFRCCIDKRDFKKDFNSNDYDFIDYYFKNYKEWD